MNTPTANGELGGGWPGDGSGLESRSGVVGGFLPGNQAGRFWRGVAGVEP